MRSLAALLVLAALCGACAPGGDDGARPTAASTTTTASPATGADDGSSRPSQPSSPTTAPPVPPPGGSSTAEGPEAMGEIVEAEALGADVPGTVHRVVYRSQRLTGEPTVVSGIVAIPEGSPPPGGWPVLAWAHGTTGVADECAPSLSGAGSIPELARHLAEGYAVAATDYEGLGTPGVHPYLVLESEGRSVLDSVRAARSLDPAVGSDVVVVGHSQGGHAALAAAEIASRWAPELDLRGTVAIAPAAAIDLIAPFLFSSGLGFTLGAFVAAGWPAAHPELDAADLLTEEGLAVVEQAEAGACTFELGAIIGDRSADALRTTTPEEVPEWAVRIAENTIHADRLTTPVLIVQGSADFVIPKVLSDVLVDDLCAAGAPVGYLVDDRADHVTIVARSAPAIHEWLAARLAGAPLPAEPACAGG